MTRPRSSPVSQLQLLQAMVARELVENLGMPAHRAAEVIGVAPSAISQYLSGKRLRTRFLEYSVNPLARRVARRVAERLQGAAHADRSPHRILLDGAGELVDLLQHGSPHSRGTVPPPSIEGERHARALSGWLRQRVRAEQAAVTQCMRLAQKARDELTRTIFRQIASDSLRHAEIVASLATNLDRGISRTLASGITRKEVISLIESERRAEARADAELGKYLQGTMALLVTSMEADERKHATLLAGLLASGFEEAGGPRRRRQRT